METPLPPSCGPHFVGVRENLGNWHGGLSDPDGHRTTELIEYSLYYWVPRLVAAEDTPVGDDDLMVCL
jgi:hypothetical protein